MKNQVSIVLASLIEDLHRGMFLHEHGSFLLTDDEETMLVSFLYTWHYLEFTYDGAVSVENNNFYIDEVYD